MSRNVIKLHIENDSSLGEVFEVTPAKIAAALERSPDMAGKFDWTIGYDCAQFDFQIADADALICWDIDTVNLAHRAPRRAYGAGYRQ